MSDPAPDPKQILDAIPDGGSISFADFAKKVGAIANFLAFASPQTLARKGGHLTITCSKPGANSSSGVTITTSAVMCTDVAISGSGVISLTNITGIKISQGIAGGALKQVSITPLSSGNFELDGTVHVGFPIGDVNFKRTVDAQGNVV